MNTYKVEEVCAFSRAKDKWGEFGNMTGGFPIRLSKDILVPSTENLYQMMRFVFHPEIQQEILEQKSGMGAKMVSKKYRKTHTYRGFDDDRVQIMYWCLRLKAAQHKKYRDALIETGTRDIVEISKKDEFWGAKPSEDGSELVGFNALGHLHMVVRQVIQEDDNSENFKVVNAPIMGNCLVLEKEIQILDFRKK
jgi:ribA/ribD-fused uncharacterized protein